MARRVKGEASRQSGEPDRHVNGEPDGQAAAALELQAGRHPWDAAVARTVALLIVTGVRGRSCSPVGTAPILERALSGHDISVDEAARLFDADGSDLLAMIAAADELRARTVGDVVTYVINRNINFTNVCVKACGFCAFSRGHLAEEGYYLPVE